MNKHSITVIAVGIVLTLLFSTTIYTLSSIDNSVYDPMVEYCDMVELYISSNGQHGWPDFRNTFYRSCQ